MTCGEVENLFPDYLQRSLSREQMDAIDGHLQACSGCTSLVSVWDRLAAIPQEQPSVNSKKRFDLMMEAYEEGRRDRQVIKTQSASWWPEYLTSGWRHFPLAQAALAVALVVIGVALGKYLNPPPPNTSTKELAALHQELTGMRQLMVLSMLQQPSASERLQGVSWSEQVKSSNPEIISALLHTVRYDSSVDVRLAALDALRRYKDQPKVRTDVLQSLRADQSPLVQIALIDFLVELRQSEAVGYLKNFEQSKDLNPSVRQHVQWGINKLSRG
jgi:putative zinc finger protein